VVDLHLPVEIVAHPTVREADGLALSSRNDYLSPDERRAAAVLYRALVAAREAIETGESSADEIRRVLHRVLRTEPNLSIDYAEVVDGETFQPIQTLRGSVVLPIAGRLGHTRLLDNLPIEIPE
jgi:pantoate--beta-alanine ligase